MTQRAPKQEKVYAFHEQEDIKLIFKKKQEIPCLRPFLLHELTQSAPKQENAHDFHEQEDINLI